MSDSHTKHVEDHLSDLLISHKNLRISLIFNIDRMK